jgi:hypothetical protein
MAISIDSLGHATYFERLFLAMKFTPTQLTFSGLRRMWRKKEYGRVYSASKKVKQRRRIKQRKKMIEGISKMKKDAEAGMAYSSGICLLDDGEGVDDGEDKDEGCGESARKKAKTINSNNSNKRTGSSRKQKEGCKCGGRDHQRITSTKCPWKGLSTSEVAKIMRVDCKK